MAEARHFNLRPIPTFAEGAPGTSENGYYTWPRLGFNGEIAPGVREELPEAVRDAKGLHALMDTRRGAMPGKRTATASTAILHPRMVKYWRTTSRSGKIRSASSMPGKYSALDEILEEDIANGFAGPSPLADYHPSPEDLARAAEFDALVWSPESRAKAAAMRAWAAQESARISAEIAAESFPASA